MSYNLDVFVPKQFPAAPQVFKMYKEMKPQDKEVFNSRNPDYFRPGNEGAIYLDRCEHVVAENTRDVAFLLDERDNGNLSKDLLDAISRYKGCKLYCTLISNRKHWNELRALSAIPKAAEKLPIEQPAWHN